MLNLAIDMGNTSIKIGVFHNDNVTRIIDDADESSIQELIREVDPENIIISSVRRSELLPADTNKKCLWLDTSTQLPIDVAYKTPNTLGKDRIAAAVGAHELYPDENCLVVDIGTCITYEYIDASGKYYGGGISLGLDMKFKALNTFTANLPLVDRVEEVSLIGDTTESSIQSGIINGTVAEIEEIIRMYKYKFSPLRIIMCGGGSSFMKKRIKSSVEVRQELVLIGLNGILKHNA